MSACLGVTVAALGLALGAAVSFLLSRLPKADAEKEKLWRDMASYPADPRLSADELRERARAFRESRW